ncbi:TMPS6 protease, partial [Certhia familiaris]|nr:TMPS6 protease [Certhia familiaris]
VSIPVAELLPHPGYHGDSSGSDVALARLARPVRYRAGIGPVCLPAPNLRFRAGTRCVSTGWGEVRPGGKLGGTGRDWDGLGGTG